MAIRQVKIMFTDKELEFIRELLKHATVKGIESSRMVVSIADKVEDKLREGVVNHESV